MQKKMSSSTDLWMQLILQLYKRPQNLNTNNLGLFWMTIKIIYPACCVTAA